MEPIRVLIADDHPFFREGVRVLLDSVPETEVVGEASSGDETIAKAATLQPDVILMDLHMPGLKKVRTRRRCYGRFRRSVAVRPSSAQPLPGG